ncbi:MAG: hypothetical protein ACJ72Q_13670 [Nitrososphaeraceae archaeon]
MIYTYLATVVDDDAIRFVSQKSKDNITSSSDNNGVDKEELNEPDYDGDQLEEEQEEEKTGGTLATTINQVF